MDGDKVSAIVLSSRDYKEKDKLVELLTLEQGLKTVVLKGVKNANAKFKFAKEPFCFGEFVLSGKNQIQVVTSANMIESFFDLTQNYDRYIVGCKILGLISIFLEKYQINSDFFLLVLKTLRELTYSQVDEKMIMCAFLTKAFDQIGYKINVSNCASCGSPFMGQIYLNADTCEIVCQNCRTFFSVPISPACHNAIKILSKCEIDSMNTIKISEDVLGDVMKIYQIILQSRFLYRDSILK